MPLYWGLGAADYLQATQTPANWGWLTLLDKGDILPLLGIAVLAGSVLPCFISLLPLYARNRDWPFFAMAACEIAVTGLAAAGIFSAGH